MEIPINKDLRGFKTKDIGQFSLKEAGCLALAGVGCLALHHLQKNYGIEKPSVGIDIFPFMVVGILLFFKPYGLTFSQFMKSVFIEKFKMPRNLIWESDVVHHPEDYEELFGEEYYIENFYGMDKAEPEEDKKKKKSRKSHKNIKK